MKKEELMSLASYLSSNRSMQLDHLVDSAVEAIRDELNGPLMMNEAMRMTMRFNRAVRRLCENYDGQ